MPSNVGIIIHNSTIEKPIKSKAQVLAVTAILNFENPTCLSANVLIEKGQEDKTEEYIDKLMDEVKGMFDNKLITTDEYHTD